MLVIVQWVYTGDSIQCGLESTNGRRSSHNKATTSETTSAKLLLNGFGWSRSQAQGKKVANNFSPSRSTEDHQNQVDRHGTNSNSGMLEPWHWFPSPTASLNDLDFASRAGGPKGDLPWKIRATVVQSIRGHHSTLRSFAVCENECTVFTAGIGPGFKGSIQKWELSGVDSVSSYNGHDEVSFYDPFVKLHSMPQFYLSDTVCRIFFLLSSL